MRKRRVERADGRYVYWYAFERGLPDVTPGDDVAPDREPLELRWNPLLDEEVIISTARQERTFLPPDEYCPLCPTRGEYATEISSQDFEIVVFENRFPGLRLDAPAPPSGTALQARGRAAGACEVVVYTPQHEASLAALPVEAVRHLIDVWADRYAELGALPDVRYVFVFENRGKEIGVTLTHPHGQIYAFPFVPLQVEREQRASAAHHERTGRCLQCDVIAGERDACERIVAEDGGIVAYVPFAARLPYEVHVAPAEHRQSLLELTDDERDALARTLRTVQAAYDRLWDTPMPYTMSMHQRATDGIERAGDHLHIEFMPLYRSRGRLKYLAGVETGAGTFLNDTSPEEKAAELRAARETL